jgi:hypothetical protein
VAYLECPLFVNPPQVQPAFNSNAAHRAQAQTIDGGVQAISMSSGTPYDGLNYCQSHRSFPECLSISYAVSRDTPMVASSGNRRTEINFPASDKRVISAGGFQQSLALWDDSPGSELSCRLSRGMWLEFFEAAQWAIPHTPGVAWLGQASAVNDLSKHNLG